MSTKKPPMWFWIVSVLALIWNGLGVMNYLGQVMAPDDLFSQMEKAMRDLIENRPTWATAAFATAVWAGALGSLLLLLRRKIAHPILILSFVGIVVQMYYNYFIANSLSDYGPGEHSMAVMILGVGFGLIYLAKKGKSLGWLN